MRRREFITLIGGAAAAWPLASPRPAWAQQRPMWVIGLLNGQSSPTNTNLIAAFRQGLTEVGYIEGRNLAIVYRGAEGDVARLPALAAELVQIPVAVIAAVGGDSSVSSAKTATTTIPIVFTTAGDPVETGIVTSLNRPGGNVTGATHLGSRVAAKQIGLLRDLVPQLTTIGLLTSPFVPMAVSVTEDVQTAAKTQGLQAVVANISGDGDLDAAFAQFTERRGDALVISSGALFARLGDRVIAFT